MPLRNEGDCTTPSAESCVKYSLQPRQKMNLLVSSYDVSSLTSRRGLGVSVTARPV